MTQVAAGIRKAPTVIRAIFAVWAFSAAVICLVVTIYATGHHRAASVTAVTQ